MSAFDIIGIVGPTAVGKSAVAEHLAIALGGEIVSADSMQVYRGMDIGTAKTPPERRAVVHHCIDLIDPGTPYSAALYQRDARAVLDALVASGVPAVVVGGTGLYVRAALDEMHFPSGEAGSAVREMLERRASVEGGAALHAELARLDPESAAMIHPNNVRRVVRALEMLYGGRSYAEHHSGFKDRRFHYPRTVLYGLTMQRPELYRRIEARVEDMIAQGLLQEVERLVDAGFSAALTSSQAIGYKELVPVVTEGADLEQAVERIKRATRRYAKRQLTWFRSDPRIVWIDMTGLSHLEATARLLHLLESSEP